MNIFNEIFPRSSFHKILSPSLILALLLVPTISSAQAVISALTGTVEYRLSADSSWIQATPKTEIPQGSTIRTGENGRAVVLFKNGSRVWLKENTSLNVEEKKSLFKRVSLLFGSIKVRVPHLKRKERFQVKAFTHVVAVRGTVFTVSARQEGQVSLQVLFGEIKLNVTGADGERILQTVKIPQGNGYSKGKSMLLTREQEVSALEDWSPGLSPEQRQKQLVDNAKKRSQIRQFAQSVNSTNREISESRQQIKEEDFAAGRTLVDVHGNVVRVDQRLDRPNGRTIQIINVVKRTEYSSSGLRKFSYQGSRAQRLDSLRAKIEFNQELPANINEFPGFFSDNDDTLDVNRSELVLANTTNENSVFTIGFFGLRNPATDDIDADLYVGTLQTSGGTNARRKLFNLRLKADRSITGLTRFVEDPRVTDITFEGTGGELYGNFAKRWHEFGNNANTLWLASEVFVINNGGGVRNISDFTGGSNDFESLLKNTAGEITVFLKDDTSNIPNITQDATNFQGGNAAKRNIDVVFIPDIFVSIVKSLASSLDQISTSLDSSFESLSNAK